MTCPCGITPGITSIDGGAVILNNFSVNCRQRFMESSRQLAAIMFTDIVGYTSLMGHDEQKAFDILKKNRELQKPIIEQFHGRWIKELGDGIMASFNTVSDAVYAAMKIQEGSKESGRFPVADWHSPG